MGMIKYLFELKTRFSFQESATSKRISPTAVSLEDVSSAGENFWKRHGGAICRYAGLDPAASTGQAWSPVAKSTPKAPAAGFIEGLASQIMLFMGITRTPLGQRNVLPGFFENAASYFGVAVPSTENMATAIGRWSHQSEALFNTLESHARLIAGKQRGGCDDLAE